MRNLKILRATFEATVLQRQLLDIDNLTFSRVRNFYEKMNYPFFISRNKNYNLNIGAIRSSDLTPDTYNDTIFLAWEWQGRGYLKTYKGTTDPGLYYLLNPINVNGTAIIIPEYYRGVYEIGWHRKNTSFAHMALRQKAPMKYWREKEYTVTSQLPINHEVVYEEIGFTNLHSKPMNFPVTQFIGKVSAGCIVVQDPVLFHNEFIPICREGAKNFGNSFSFALFYEPDLI
jgi:hypothetical protein